MDYLSEVYSKIHELGFMLIGTDKNIHAVTLEFQNNYGIFINYKKIKNSAKEFRILSHECGHCKTGATHKVYSPYQLIEQHEYRANRAAVLDFLPFDKLLDAAENGCTEVWQIAEYLDMPNEFVALAIDIYKREGKI